MSLLIRKELAEGQLYRRQEKNQMTRVCLDRYTARNELAYKKELAVGRLYRRQ